MIAGSPDLTLQDDLPHYYKAQYFLCHLEAESGLHFEREQAAIAALSKLPH